MDHINETKEKVISTDVKKIPEKNQHPFMTGTLRNAKTEGKFNILKGI
jgi:ribosomal protein L31